jgi:SAM-dependent methyltransferase
MTGPAAAAVTTPPSSYYDQADGVNRCILCGDPRYTLHREITHFGFPFRFSRCRCGMIKQTPMPNERFFEWFFNSDLFLSARESDSENIWGFYDYLRDEDCRLATSRSRYRRLRRVFDSERPLRIMKIGPSTGSMLYVARTHGHDAIGCDVSSTFVSYAEEQYGVRIDHGRFERLPYEPGSFDVILLFNVVENVPNLSEFLASIANRLRPGGRFVLNHVDMGHNLIERFQKEKYFMYRPPICYMFETPVLHRLLTQHGFEVELELRDLRYMHLEKILTLLGWRRVLKVARALRIDRIKFPIPAYPSRITVARKS